MLPQFNILKYDKETQQLKKQWEEVFPTEPFPSLTYDFDSHKQKIKKAIETKNYSIVKDVDELVD